MKKILLVLIIILISANVFSADIHGVYISTWNKGLFNKSEVDKTINDAKNAHITDLFIQIRKFDDAYYDSKIVQKATNIPNNFDMLEYAIKEAKKHNIKIHAWFVICRINSGDYKNNLSAQKISWLDKNIKGQYIHENNVFIDPSNYDARKYIISLIKEVTDKYNIDGVHLDYIRYPSIDFGYSDNSVMNFMLESGELVPQGKRFDNFRREQITKLIKEIRNNINKKITLSASIIAWGEPTDYQNLSSYKQAFQDYKKWLDYNIVDYVMPMIYKREHVEKQAEDYVKWLKVYTPYKHKIIPAIGGYLNTSQGIKKQITKTENEGFNNWVIFDFNDNQDRINVINALK